jgi:ribulose-phosphate 3-epimerase
VAQRVADARRSIGGRDSSILAQAVAEPSACGLLGTGRARTWRDAAPIVLPSLLLCDFGNLEREVERLTAAGFQGLHLDVMDGHFVPNLTYGFPVVEAVRRLTELPLDVHLMIERPERYLEQFAAAGADSITVHVEATGPGCRAALQEIRRLGRAAGVAINPGTPLTEIDDCLDDCDLVLVMSVEPGFGGQEFQVVALHRLEQLRRHPGRRYRLEVDGGVNEANIGSCAAAGAELFVAGSAIFGHQDYATRLSRLTALAASQASGA